MQQYLDGLLRSADDFRILFLLSVPVIFVIIYLLFFCMKKI
jgi:hypothetical protein